MIIHRRILEKPRYYFNVLERSVTYIQGQEPTPKTREYFYYVNHEGMLFLDDSKMKNFTSCFKEKKFLQFFFKHMKINETGRYMDDFPYVSLCGRERNYVRCDDCPVVFTHIVNDQNDNCHKDMIAYGYAGDSLAVDFEPQKIFMLPDTGRVYHPVEDKYSSIGLIKSKLAIELSKLFTFRGGEGSSPTHFTWRGVDHLLDQEWFYLAKEKHKKQ